MLDRCPGSGGGVPLPGWRENRGHSRRVGRSTRSNLGDASQVRCRCPQSRRGAAPLRHDALDVLTPDAAYWCGFIFTDGTIVHRTGIRRGGQPEIAVVLQRRDRDHLVKLRDFLGSTHAITPVAPATVSPNIARPNGGQGTGAFRYSVRSQRLADRLTALGRYGPAVDPALAASCDFWRGCIDGDGTVGISCGIPQVEAGGLALAAQRLRGFPRPGQQQASARRAASTEYLRGQHQLRHGGEGHRAPLCRCQRGT